MLAARLAQARRDAGLTQEALAQKLGRPQSYVAKIEGQERRLDLIEFLEIAAAVDINPAPLLKDLSRLIRRQDSK